MQKRMCTFAEMDVIIMEIISFINERPLGETNINDENIPITPNMLATGRPLRQLRTPITAIMESINPDKMWLERKRILNHFWDKWQVDYLTTLSIDVSLTKRSLVYERNDFHDDDIHLCDCAHSLLHPNIDFF